MITADYYGTTRGGTIFDRASALANVNAVSHADDRKVESIKSVQHGDTVIETYKESWTGVTDKLPHSSYVNEVYVKQGGAWKLAARFGTDIPPGK